jgi:hypothetical protein
MLLKTDMSHTSIAWHTKHGWHSYRVQSSATSSYALFTPGIAAGYLLNYWLPVPKYCACVLSPGAYLCQGGIHHYELSQTLQGSCLDASCRILAQGGAEQRQDIMLHQRPQGDTPIFLVHKSLQNKERAFPSSTCKLVFCFR